jgi:hypothetical protein
MFGHGYLLGALQYLRPYSEAGLCSQRWYDLSAEATFLSHSNGGLSGGLTTQGSRDVIPTAPIVLSLGDADAGNDIEAGMRLSASFIFGAGANIEGTYMGNNQWQSDASFSDGTPNLFSFISVFGTDPTGGFVDTDQAFVQSVASESEFHSGELNYRRRTMGPYCRFQGSWLVGLRYVRFENGLLYSSLGDLNSPPTRFFTSNDSIKNNLFGPQAGFDLWWNMRPGVNLGIGMKGAWVQNDIDRRIALTANSFIPPPGASVSVIKDQDTTVMGEFEAKMAYRLSHSWTFRSAYYAIAVDDMAFGTVDRQYILGVAGRVPLTKPALHLNSLVVQGFSFGAEYIW